MSIIINHWQIFCKTEKKMIDYYSEFANMPNFCPNNPKDHLIDPNRSINLGTFEPKPNQSSKNRNG